MSQASTVTTQGYLTTATFRRIEDYAKTTGTTIQKAINEAVTEWMDTTGDLIKEEFISRRGPVESRSGSKKPSASVTCITKDLSSQTRKSATISTEQRSTGTGPVITP
jgi:hypothetical protein